MSKKTFFLMLFFSGFIIFLSCKDPIEEQTNYLFKELSTKQTNIGFANTLKEDKDHSIINYIYFYNGGGVAVGDINNDGLPDLYFVSNQNENKLYVNKGNLEFEDVTKKANVAGNSDWSTGVTMVDINNDGFLDIYVCAVSELLDFKGHNELFINNGDGTFSEESKKYGLDFKGYSTQAYFFDYDKDNDLDVYLVNHAIHTNLSHGKASQRNKRQPLVGDVLFSLSVAGNIFLGQTEAPLLIKAYLAKMNRSEVMLVMTGGMATVAGGVLASYVGFLGGTDPELRLSFARHLIAASVMAAPGAIIIAKLMVPQTEPIDEKIEVSDTEVGSNALDALSNGTTEGLKLALNVGAMLLVFIAFIAMINGILTGVGDLTGINDWIAANSSYTELSLESILGTIFAPLMYIIGVASEDLNLMGQLLGIKLVASEFVAYTQLAELKNMAAAVHLTYDKSVLMATYMLCGFANFASIGIQIGGIGTIAPSQKKTLSELGFRALIAGSLASLLSATIAGMILG